MQFFQLLFAGSIVAILYMSLIYILSVIKKDSSIVDIAWGIGFITVNITTLVITQNYNARNIIILILVSLWGIRLAAHIFSRNKGKDEDWRYKKWREDWGNFFLIRSYFQIFVVQAILLTLISIPFIFANSQNYVNFTIFDILGILIWAIGFIFEAVGDWQLSKFKSKPENKGKIMTKGLWQYTRHPNYFGEVTLWWGIYLLVVSIPKGIFTIIGPITITILILAVSGIPMLEKKYEDNEDFQDYKKKTNAFFPWFPKG